MRCQKCGYEDNSGFAFCRNCGSPMDPNEPPAPANTVADAVLSALKDTLFLVLCILMSASCALTLIESGPDVLRILFTIFFWLLYAKSRNNEANVSHLRAVSGTVYAHYIIVNVCAVLVIVFGGVIALFFDAFADNPFFMNELLSDADLAQYGIGAFSHLLVSLSGAVIFLVFALVGALLIVINMFSIRYIHRFAQSVYRSVESGTPDLKHGKTTYIWLWVFGIFSAFTFLGSLRSPNLTVIASSAVECALPIVAALLLKKYLLAEPSPAQEI